MIRAHRHRVVILGAGFAGLAVARNLRGVPVDVTIVDANNFHTFQPLLYQVATAGLGADDIGYPVRGIFRRQHNVSVRMARVVGVDLERRLVHTDPGGPMEYDALVVATGAVSTSFGVPGVDEHALGLKTLDDALAVRRHVMARFEEAADGEAGDGALNVVIRGGGPTGVGLAGGMAEPQVAQPAIQGGRYVAMRIARRLTGGDVEADFAYRDKGSMATIGRHAAVAELANGWRLSGPAGWLAWLGLHLVYLMGFRNRAAVLLGWAWNYLTFDHAARLLAGERESLDM